jgi:hypothetical protein
VTCRIVWKFDLWLSAWLFDSLQLYQGDFAAAAATACLMLSRGQVWLLSHGQDEKIWLMDMDERRE